MAAPTIVSVSPTSGATGVAVNTTVTITFDSEVDTFRIKNGGIVFEGPDESKSIGPGYLDMQPPDTDEDNILTSPAYKGIVKTGCSFRRVDGTGNVVPYYDYGSGVDAGTVYRTQVVLTPEIPLGSLTEYTVYIVGDEDQTDAYDFGVSSRSIFDTVKESVLGDGTAIFYGGYTGSIRDKFTVQITQGGGAGTATYEWWRDSDPVARAGKTSTGYRLLSDGVQVSFEKDRTYQLGDTFHVWCDVPEFMENTYSFSFTTSQVTIEDTPVSSTLLTGGVVTGSTTVSSSSFAVSSITPESRDSMVDNTTTEIQLVFSSEIDATTITDDSVTVTSYAADESIDQSFPFTGELTKTLSVSGSTLTITLDADQLYDNNLVVTTVDSSVSSSGGYSLSEEYESFFATTYTPFYAGTRIVRLRLGSYGNNIPEETINFAIWQASLEAQALAASSTIDANAFNVSRRMFTACLAAYWLIGGGKLSNGGVRKRLADLDISRDAGNIKEIDDSLRDCLGRYELALMTGGESGFGGSLKPKNVVKGDNDPDEPCFGRRWVTPTTPVANSRTTGHSWRRYYKTNRRRT